MPVERVEAAVVAKLTRDTLRPAVVRALLTEVLAALRPDSVTTNERTLRADLQVLDAKIARLTEAVESGAALAPLVAKLQARQTEREQLVASIASAEATRQVEVNRRDLERRVMAQIDQWRELLVSNGRQLLREALDGPIRFTPTEQGYRFEGHLQMGVLIEGLIGGVHPLWRAQQDSNLRPPA